MLQEDIGARVAARPRWESPWVVQQALRPGYFSVARVGMAPLGSIVRTTRRKRTRRLQVEDCDASYETSLSTKTAPSMIIESTPAPADLAST